MRPARTLVSAFAERADVRPEAAFGLGQVLGADPIAAQIVVAPAEEILSIAVFDVMAVGLDDGCWRRLPVVAGNGAVDLFQESRGIERSKRPRAGVEQARQRHVVAS